MVVTEMLQATQETGIDWLTELCNITVKGCILDDWKSSLFVPVYKGKGDHLVCSSYRGNKLLEDAVKIVTKVLSALFTIRKRQMKFFLVICQVSK